MPSSRTTALSRDSGAQLDRDGSPDTDRLFPADPGTRAIARELYQQIATKPIISPHGHVPIGWLSDDQPFANAAELLVIHDHYVTRLLHADGVGFDELGRGERSDPREVWRAFASRFQLFAGTATGYWVQEVLSGVLGVRAELGPETADETYDAIGAQLARPEFWPRALLDRFRIDYLATTDDPLDELDEHDRVNAAGLNGCVAPTFRPDVYVDPDRPEFRERVAALLTKTGEPSSFAGYLNALQARREHFIKHGARAADHAAREPLTAALDAGEAARLFECVLSGSADADQRRLFRAHMLVQMARMSVADGLVMMLHTGVQRNHSSATFERYGVDMGHDIPLRTDFVNGLRPLLESYGLEPNFHLVLFTVDETTFSREIAPLAGFYPSVYIGAPWWFLDAPDAIARFRAAVTETAGFYRTSGFIDDTRAFMSIPVRHDTARRVDCAFLARLVREGRIGQDQAATIADDLVDAIPRRAFKL